jgi:lipopolysaccharide/colanic/teichoic acid biosynthesis glycosyltransferase
MMTKNALQKIESHEKLCRIMQKQTHKKIHSIEERVKRLEKILLTCTGALIASMAFLIYTLISHLTL